MSKSTRSIKISRADYARVLATETLPYETPIIFSNDGLHKIALEAPLANPIANFLVEKLVLAVNIGPVHSTIPFSYKIRKNSLEFRKLSLIHPISQLKIKEFYAKYEKLILYYCSRSQVTIRAPHKIASTYFKKGSWENINQYKSGTVAEVWTDGIARHCPSFFSYRGVDRLYKFFNSPDYFNLEKRFEYFLNLDVSKCFDSIYTHSLSWAIKDKEFTKKQVAVSSTFPQEFDALMRHTNHGETNGIVIGPELSRIFAEVLFQTIDQLTIKKLEKLGLEIDNDYSMRRYVDDVFIFAHSEETARRVYSGYADILSSFNLHPNIGKSQLIRRPFHTVKSRVIWEAEVRTNNFLETFLETVDGSKRLTPKTIGNKWAISQHYIEAIKSLCSQNQVGYDELSSFLISVFFERIKKLVNVPPSSLEDNELVPYRDACLVVLDVMYFLYSVAPSVGASYKFCTAIIILIRFAKKHLGEHNETIKQRIFELSQQLLMNDGIGKEKTVDRFLSLESMNIALAIKELGEGYAMPTHLVEHIFSVNEHCTYFDIAAGLYYVGSDKQYEDLKKLLLAEADRKLSNLSDIKFSAEKAYLLLDLLSCPHIYESQKVGWLKKLYKEFKTNYPPKAEVDAFLNNTKKLIWFINWNEVDLLNSLEKKELKRAY